MSNSNHIDIRHAKIYKNVYKFKVEVGKVPVVEAVELQDIPKSR